MSLIEAKKREITKGKVQELRLLHRRINLILNISVLLIAPYAFSYSAAKLFSWNANVVLLISYSTIIFVVVALILTLRFGEHFRAGISKMKVIKATLIVITCYILIILTTTGWQHYEYTQHPELFSITEEIQKGATLNNQKTNKEKLMAISAESEIQHEELSWLIPIRQKLQLNKSKYEEIKNGTYLLPIDTIVTLFDPIDLPPGTESAFYIKMYDAKSHSRRAIIRIPGQDYISSIDEYIVNINQQLANNKAYAAELTRNVSKIKFINFLYFTLSGQVYTQSTFFQIIDMLFYKPATWLALLILSGLVDFSRQRG